MFDRAIVGPHRRHMQTFEGFLEGFNTKIPSSIEQGFAENHLMEVTQHFAPKLLESDPELIDIYNKYDDEKKFFKIFQYVAFKWANSELDLSGTDLEPYKDFRLRGKSSQFISKAFLSPINNIKVSLFENYSFLIRG